ncbi:hypothetical protein SAMN05444412_102376 [Rhodonellum ikkaensis]|uniref:Uncharacterized protein n=1 Tax=Rhodonellum ikkaensis TaxID=336829 RepID=A0A1H3M954_9BACT|nr:hypothetical protein SAMN05444412_102376 [Rhodonellum ikkaensis]
MHYQFNSSLKILYNQSVVYCFLLHHIENRPYSPNSLIFLKIEPMLVNPMHISVYTTNGSVLK